MFLIIKFFREDIAEGGEKAIRYYDVFSMDEAGGT